MSIYQDIFKYYIIINSFKNSDIQSLSYKQEIKKIQSYKKSNSKKRIIDDINDDEPKLSRLLLSRPAKIWDIAAKVREFSDRDPTKFLDNSPEVFKIIIKLVNL